MEYEYGWDAEKMMAWRLEAKAKKSDHPEFAAEMVPPEDGKGHSAMRARFGKELVEIAQITLDKFNGAAPPLPGAKRKAAAKANKGKGKVVAGEHGTALSEKLFKGTTTDGKDIAVSFKNNNYTGKPKQRLVIVKQGGGQLWQVDLANFKVKHNVVTDEDAEIHAAEWTYPIVKAFAEGAMTHDECLNKKQELLDEVKKLKDKSDSPAASADAEATAGADAPATVKPKKKANAAAKPKLAETAETPSAEEPETEAEAAELAVEPPE